jgi:hypothetical protein
MMCLNSVWIFSNVARRVETPGPSHEGHSIDLFVSIKLEGYQATVCVYGLCWLPVLGKGRMGHTFVNGVVVNFIWPELNYVM